VNAGESALIAATHIDRAPVTPRARVAVNISSQQFRLPI
jgi:hypothetical protein